MASNDQPKGQTESSSQIRISENAFQRLMALRKAQINAAERMLRDDYPDFFVEGSGPAWHERWPEVISGEKFFTTERMLFVDRLSQDDYPDFFVEGSGPAWHERWPEVISGEQFDPGDTRQRLRALQSLNVVQAFINMKTRTGQ